MVFGSCGSLISSTSYLAIWMILLRLADKGSIYFISAFVMDIVLESKDGY
jgi:hypothetical protein